MLNLSNLRPAAGSTKKVKRVGRGQGSGRGGTSTRGHKGDAARSGAKEKRGFEGGQMPLQMRVPKRGFKNINRKEYVVFNLTRLQEIAEKHNLTELNDGTLRQLRYIAGGEEAKVCGDGELTANIKLNFERMSHKVKVKLGIVEAEPTASDAISQDETPAADTPARTEEPKTEE